MAEVTSELIYRTLIRVHEQLDGLDGKMCDILGQIRALRTHMAATHLDLQNISAILLRHDARLERIERRLEIAEVTA